ncbi:YdaS family helix-turn-helix protein [Devosia ginsengisoli]|uniref:transcriptional regulator n=1 Tax=Devosia ginsengisoli TaxID=400770 RepID=UPI0026EF2FCA|nr:YdaS family helix-turn-helix protein [Devosia ginsengisoli]MCR6672168.1 helix-turn-helix domain-containing protein [Devosia ginsengisoli]
MSNKSDMAAALQRAVEIIGGPTEAGRVFDITPQAVDQWEICPPGRVLGIESAAGGQVTRYELRPDIYGDAPELVTP